MSFGDGNGSDFDALSVEINPVQDLNGYSAPWPAGGGKNIAHDVRYTSASSQYYAAIACSVSFVSGKRYVFSFKTPNTGERVYRQSPSSLGFSSLSGYSFTCDGGRKSFYGTASSDATYTNKSIVLKQDNDSIPVGLCSEFMIEEVEDTVTTPSDYAPYENICPISGWTEAKVQRTGINIWDEQTEDGYITTTGVLSPYANAIRSKNFTSCKPNEKYVHHHKQGMNGCTIAWYDESKTFIRRDSVVDGSNNVVFTAPGNAYYFKLSFYNYKVQDAPTYNNDVSINYPHTNSGYYAYSGASVTIDLNGTRYGGTLDVLTGVLAIDRAYVDLGTLVWYRNAISG